jgi:hypothetical protein
VNIVLENRDRLAQVWSLVRDHLRWLLTHFPQNEQLMERVVVSIIRIANRNLFRLVSQQQSHQPMGIAISPNSPHQIGPNDGQKSSQTTTTLAVTKQSATLVNTRSVVIVVDSEDEQPAKQGIPLFWCHIQYCKNISSFVLVSFLLKKDEDEKTRRIENEC